MRRRFALRRGRLGAIALVLHGATDETSYVDVDDDAVAARYGWRRFRVPRAEIGDVGPVSWPWWLGSGWRLSISGTLVVGPAGAGVRVQLRRPRRTALTVLPFQVRALYLGVEDIDGLIAAIASTA